MTDRWYPETRDKEKKRPSGTVIFAAALLATFLGSAAWQIWQPERVADAVQSLNETERQRVISLTRTLPDQLAILVGPQVDEGSIWFEARHRECREATVPYRRGRHRIQVPVWSAGIMFVSDGAPAPSSGCPQKLKLLDTGSAIKMLVGSGEKLSRDAQLVLRTTLRNEMSTRAQKAFEEASRQPAKQLPLPVTP